MEGPLEVKDSTTGAEEPIKSEAPVQSPDGSDHSDGAASPPPNCSICLGKLVNTSFTDSCLHQFCFTCLLQWSKIRTECPLCKQTFRSIIHNVRSEEDYDQYHVPRELASQMQQPQVMALDLNLDVDERWDVGVHRFLYRTTMTGNRRHAMAQNSEQAARREQPPSTTPQPSREERRRRRNYRHTIYRVGVWATGVPGIYGRFRECSADYYRREPWELNRLVPWLNRDLQVLLNDSASCIAYVMRIILEALSQYDIRSPEFRHLVRPYFGVRTDHFVHELLSYARTNFDIAEYDRVVTYLPEGMSNQYVPNVVSPTSSSSSTSSDDSDVRVLDEAIDLRINAEMPGIGPHQISMPGPSTVGQAFQIEQPYSVPDVFTISSDSSSCDDCEVIGYVRPRHERTPEVIELISSDPEELNTCQTSNTNAPPLESTRSGDCPEPNTSHKRGLPPSSWESDSDSDSDYNCRRSRRYGNRAKKSSKKTSATKRRNQSKSRCHARKSRNLSSSGESEIRRRGSRRSSAGAVRMKLSSSSDSSYHGTESKKADNKRSRKYSTKGTVRVRKDLIKRQERYTPGESSSSGSGSESEDEAKNSKSRTSKKSRRKYVSSSSDCEPAKSDRVTRTKSKIRQMADDVSTSKELDKKDQRCKKMRRSRSRNSSTSSYSSQKEKHANSRRYEFQRETSEHGSQDDNHSVIKDLSRKDHEPKFKSKVRRIIRSSSDSEDDLFRPGSQCSNYSNKSYGHWKKSKHKDKRKSKERKQSSSKTNSVCQLSVNGASSNISSSLKNDAHSTSKHSDSKSNSSSRERRKSHKSRKESKHRRSQNESKSKSKKTRRRIRVSSSSNSE